MLEVRVVMWKTGLVRKTKNHSKLHFSVPNLCQIQVIWSTRWFNEFKHTNHDWICCSKTWKSFQKNLVLRHLLRQENSVGCRPHMSEISTIEYKCWLEKRKMLPEMMHQWWLAFWSLKFENLNEGDPGRGGFQFLRMRKMMMRSAIERMMITKYGILTYLHGKLKGYVNVG